MSLKIFKHLLKRVSNRNGAGAHYCPPTASAVVFDSALDFDAQVRERERSAEASSSPPALFARKGEAG